MKLLRRFLRIFEIIFYTLVCFLTPVKKNKIVFSCHGGRAPIACNPKYICLELLKQNLPIEIVWITDKKNKFNIKEFEKFKTVKIIDNKQVFEKMTALASAKIWVENALKSEDYQKGLFKKRSQIYINTWHGSFGIKKMFFDTANFNSNTIWTMFFKKEIKDINCMFASCAWEKSIYNTGLKYEKKVLLIGNSRNDLFFKDQKEIRKKIIRYFNLDENKKILLYAPTFRDKSAIAKMPDFAKIKKALEYKFGCKFVIFSRFHIQDVFDKNLMSKFDSKYADVSFYPDMQELLCACDILISDYSSSMFDFMLLKKPCFVIAYDYEEFMKQRGLYYSLEETPFLIAKNDIELVENIKKFEQSHYLNKVEAFLDTKNVINDGQASSRAVGLIKEILN